jgi:hypothetical protein
MILPAYDIFKKDAAGAMIWVEGVENLESAKIRVKQLSLRKRSDLYVD